MLLKVHKVRFVASTLLDAVKKAEIAPASAARAHAYLCMDICFLAHGRDIRLTLMFPGDFLSILSEIERNYLCVSIYLQGDCHFLISFLRLDDDRDGTSSGDGMTMLS
jgi:hypothetical protein